MTDISRTVPTRQDAVPESEVARELARAELRLGKPLKALRLATTTALASAEAKGAREQREAREMLACKLAMTLKAYRRELPCGCADCAPADGMHTNGGCRHSPLRSIIAYLTHPTEGHDDG